MRVRSPSARTGSASVHCVAKTKAVAKQAQAPKARTAARSARSSSVKPAARKLGKDMAGARPAGRNGGHGAKAPSKKTASAAKPATPARASRSTRGATQAASAPRLAAGPPEASSSPQSAASATAAATDLGETLASRDVGRLLRYGERFGTDRIDVRMLPLQLHVRSGSLGVFDPAAPQTWHVLERRTGNGAFRVMLSVARSDDAPEQERLAAVVIHVGRPPIARWTVAQFEDGAGASEALPRTRTGSGWLAVVDASEGVPGVLALPQANGVTPVEVPLVDGRRALALPGGNGQFAAYWAIDAADKPICIVFDFDAFTQKAWKAKPPG